MTATAEADTTPAIAGTAKVGVEGADIVYDYDGQGPPLLLVPGAGGDARVHADLARELRGRYTVVRHDRRCNARSTGDRGRTLDVAQHARDAAAVIDAMESGPAWVFGNGAGGAIALQLAIASPERVRGLVVHEPLVPALLPDAGAWRAVFERIEAAVDAQGIAPAARLLASATGVRLTEARLDIFLRRELAAFSRHLPDLARLRRHHLPMLAVAGHLDRHACGARAAHALAAGADCAFHAMGGGHLAFIADPAGFALELAALLDRLESDRAAR